MSESRNGTAPIVVVRDIHKSFGDVRALDGVSLDVERGTVLGLLGPNGAGKTTLVRILTTLLDPDEGSATVAGYDVRRAKTQVRPLIGLAGQSAAIDDTLTGRENLEMVARLYHMRRAMAVARAGELLARFDLLDAADRPARSYSGGMRRRLDLAASLVADPEVLFLDEPSTGLDPHARLELWVGRFRSWNRGERGCLPHRSKQSDSVAPCTPTGQSQLWKWTKRRSASRAVLDSRSYESGQNAGGVCKRDGRGS